MTVNELVEQVDSVLLNGFVILLKNTDQGALSPAADSLTRPQEYREWLDTDGALRNCNKASTNGVSLGPSEALFRPLALNNLLGVRVAEDVAACARIVQYLLGDAPGEDLTTRVERGARHGHGHERHGHVACGVNVLVPSEAC